MNKEEFGKLSDVLLDQAKRLGICDKGLQQWSRDNQDAMIRLWVDNIDFGISHDWPSLEVMDLFGRDVLSRCGVWVDHEFADGNWELPYGGIMVLNGTCTGVLRFRGWQVATVYVRHTSDVRVESYDRSRVTVRAYDTSSVLAKHCGANKMSVWPRSAGCVVATAGEEYYHEYFGEWER